MVRISYLSVSENDTIIEREIRDDFFDEKEVVSGKDL